MRILIDVRLDPGLAGGLEALVIGLACGFRELQDTVDHKITFLCKSGGSDFLRPYVGKNVGILEDGSESTLPLGSWFTRLKKTIPIVGKILRGLGLRRPGTQSLELQNLPPITFETKFDLIHSINPMLPIKDSRPQILTVHDFQHHYFPCNFSPETIRWRETVHPLHFRIAKKIVAISEFTRKEIVRIYSVPKEKTQVIHWGPPMSTYVENSEVVKQTIIKKYALNLPYFVYPSLTYAHKNHLALIDSVAWIKKNKKQSVRIICTGAKKLAWPQISKRLKENNLENDIEFVGFLSPSDMKVVFENAKGLIFPSLYEGFGLAIVEALELGKPIACSDLEVFRELAGDVPFYFDPNSIESIANGILKLLDGNTIDCLKKQKVSINAWSDVARKYVDVYESVFF